MRKIVNHKLKNRKFAIDWLERQSRDQPNRTFIIYQDNSYSYEFVDKKANQVARVGIKLGLKSGDVVAIMMQNEPAFLWTFFGLQKIGVTASLINYHLRHKSLVHCINTCEPKMIITGQGEELQNSLKEIRHEISSVRVLCHGEDDSSSDIRSLCSMMDVESTEPVGRKYRANIGEKHVSSFIFTSGTTGLPKAAVITHRRTVFSSALFTSFSFNRDDILYETLPLYHSAALNGGIFAVINAGAKVVLRSKFSVNNFWEDCRKHNVTVIHYIGEMCRYLVDTPKSKQDGVHNIRVAVGSGLRRDVWETFTKRFKIAKVVEFYSATESMTGFINTCNKIGAVGRSSPLTRVLYPLKFVEFNHATQTAKRDSNGRCIPVGKNKTGLLLSPIAKRQQFDGYHNRPDETEKKILRDVIKPGDMYFNTGDLFYVDDDFFVHFQDRIGDTFRWKGENVSTSEVADVLCSLDAICDANVYGVAVPGCDGRAGMAAIQLKNDVTISNNLLHAIADRCSAHLPFYASPKFLRFPRNLVVTSTFKQQKMQLVKEGFNPDVVKDPLFYFAKKINQYRPMNLNVFKEIVAGEIKL